MELPRINFLPGQHFECTACGKCCKGDWNIAVDNESFSRLQTTGSFAKRKKQGYIPLLVSDNQASVGRKQDGGCVFLGENNLCDIHGEVGLENKPLVCQTYPNMLTNTPEGYFVSLSFACPAVLNNAGQSMETRREQLGRTLARAGKAVPQNVPLAERVRVAGEATVSWDEFLKLEQHMMAAFKPSQPARSVLTMAEQLAEAALSGGMAGLISDGFSRTQPSEYGQQLLEVFSVNCISIMELEKEPENRVEFMDRLMTAEGILSPRHGCHLPAFSPTLRAKPADLSLIRYYFQNIVFGKRLNTVSLLDGLLTVAVGMALLVYYLEVFGAGHQEQQAREKAFELIEGDVVTHSRGLNVLLDEFPNALVAYLAQLAPAA